PKGLHMCASALTLLAAPDERTPPGERELAQDTADARDRSRVARGPPRGYPEAPLPNRGAARTWLHHNGRSSPMRNVTPAQHVVAALPSFAAPSGPSRRGLLLRASLAATGAVLAACAAPGRPGAGGTTAARSLQPANLSFWIWAAEQLETVQQRANLTTRKHPQIKVAVEVTATFWDKWQAAVAGGVPPDLMWVDPAAFTAYVWKGVWLDLQPYVDADREFREIIGGCFKSNVANYLYKCRLGAVPRNAACVAIAYNEDLLAREGLRPPAEIQDTWTWDTLVEYAQRLTRREGDQVTQWGYYGGGTGIHAYGPFLYSNGGRVFDDGGTWQATIGAPAAMQAIEYLSDLIRTHRVEPPPDVLATLGGEATAFRTGRVAMTTMGSWVMKPTNEVQGLRYNVARAPLSPHTKKSLSHTIGLAAAVSATTKHPAEAAEVAKHLASIEAQRDI
ncbi:MAG: ABC transporter substrate-binding protein, partial [Chloroflexota bacterium]